MKKKTQAVYVAASNNNQATFPPKPAENTQVWALKRAVYFRDAAVAMIWNIRWSNMADASRMKCFSKHYFS